MNLKRYIKILEELNNYHDKTFTLSLQFKITRLFMRNVHFQEDPEVYIKGYLLRKYFPGCHSMKIKDYQIYDDELAPFPKLYCAVNFNTNEYKESVVKCLDHFLISPHWEVCLVEPINKKWHN